MFVEECNFQFSQNMKPGNKFIIDKFSNKESEKGATEGSSKVEKIISSTSKVVL